MSDSIKDRTAKIMRMAGNIAPTVILLHAQAVGKHDPLPDVAPVARDCVDYAQAIVAEVLKRCTNV